MDSSTLKNSAGAGKESIEFVNGSRILFGARERGFGRGFAGIDLLIFDEAQILSENAMDDMVPATNAASNPLVILMGTPPKPSDPGEVFTMLRQEAIEGESNDVAYVEISADRGTDPLDRAQWRKMNPSFPRRTSERAILRLHKTLGEDSFRREAMGVWDETHRFQPVVKLTEWNDLADYAVDGLRPNALGVDMSHNRDISISACWISEDGTAHVEEVWAGPSVPAATQWLSSRTSRRTPVVIDAMSPAAAMIPDLNALRVKVTQTNASDMARACGLLVDRINAGSITHGDQESITTALMKARKRPIRDAGGWGWDRRDETTDISPLIGFTLALFGASSTKRSSNGQGRPSSRREIISL